MVPGMTFAEFKRSEVLRYAALAADPGWIDYVRHEVKTAAKDHPYDLGDLPQLVAAEIKTRQS
jgi:hypothetical protein